MLARVTLRRVVACKLKRAFHHHRNYHCHLYRHERGGVFNEARHEDMGKGTTTYLRTYLPMRLTGKGQVELGIRGEYAIDHSYISGSQTIVDIS